MERLLELSMKNIVVTELLGGLGNQMFQYAIGRALSEKCDSSLYLCTNHFSTYSLRKYELHHYRIKESFATDSLVKKFGVKFRFKKKTLLEKVISRILPELPDQGFTELKEKQNFIFDRSILEQNGNLYLTGYWQSPKYFESIQDIIREEFQLKSNPKGLNLEYLKIFSEKKAVAVHIRRGDYVTNASTASFHGACSIDYYIKAAEMVIEKIKPDLFVVFSDDISWCRENIHFPIKTNYMEHNSPDQGSEDIRLMQNCSAHIIANSTFSWWGAWLAGEKSQMVIAPMQWTAKNEDEKIDIYPEAWIRI
jgi:hypothetical protein